MTTIRSEIQQEVFGTDLRANLRSLAKPGGARVVARLVGIAAWTAGSLVLLLAGMWTTAPWPRRQLRWRSRLVKRWARGVGAIAGMRVTLRGTPPDAPFFLVANHQSYVDIVLLLGYLDGVFVAKRELGHWPVVGYLNRLVGTIFVDRARRRDAKRVLTAIDRRIAMGDGVIIFPEGTSSSGDGVQPMKTALFEWAAEREHPVRVATIHYRTIPPAPSARLAVCWWGNMSFIPHAVELCRMPRFEATLHFGREPLVGNDRGSLALRARETIAANFVAHRVSDGPEIP